MICIINFSGEQIRSDQIRSRRMTCAARVACMEGSREMGARFCYEKMKGLHVRFRHRLKGLNWIDIAQDRTGSGLL